MTALRTRVLDHFLRTGSPEEKAELYQTVQEIVRSDTSETFGNHAVSHLVEIWDLYAKFLSRSAEKHSGDKETTDLLSGLADVFKMDSVEMAKSETRTPEAQRARDRLVDAFFLTGRADLVPFVTTYCKDDADHKAWKNNRSLNLRIWKPLVSFYMEWVDSNLARRY